MYGDRKLTLQDDKINLILQLLIKLSNKELGVKTTKEMCDDYGLWEDSDEFRSGEKRD